MYTCIIDHYGPKKEERAADTDEEPTRKAVYEKLGIPPSSWNPDMGNLKDTVAYRLKVTTFDGLCVAKDVLIMARTLIDKYKHTEYILGGMKPTSMWENCPT